MARQTYITQGLRSDHGAGLRASQGGTEGLRALQTSAGYLGTNERVRAG